MDAIRQELVDLSAEIDRMKRVRTVITEVNYTAKGRADYQRIMTALIYAVDHEPDCPWLHDQKVTIGVIIESCLKLAAELEERGRVPVIGSIHSTLDRVQLTIRHNRKAGRLGEFV